MSKKVVTLTIKLKNGVSSVLSNIGLGLKKTNLGFKKLAIAGVAATTAIIGGLVGLAKAYSEQETVNKKMKDTFDAAGESGAKAVIVWGAFATSIQRVTALGDEEVMNLITLAKTMGIANSEIENATRGAIGLSKAFGIDLNSSMKMVALATQGEYTMLQRYIPALRAVSTDAEKAAIVQTAMARGFKVASGELDTIAGAWLALKGVIGDAMQEVGRVLFGDGGLVSGLASVKQKIIDLTEGGVITKWAEQAKLGLDAVVATIRVISAGGGDARGRVVKSLTNVIKASFIDGATRAVQVMSKYIPMIGTALGESAMNALKNIGRDKDRLSFDQESSINSQMKALRSSGSTIAQRRALRSELTESARLENKRTRLAEEGKKLSSQISDTSNSTSEALSEFLSVLNNEVENLGESAGKVTKETGAITSFNTSQKTTKTSSAQSFLGVTPTQKTQSSSFIALAKRLETAFDGKSMFEKVDISDAVRKVAQYEKIGSSRGITGLGAEAESAIIGGSGIGGGLETRMRELMDMQTIGKDIAGGELSNPAMETNTILKEQNEILKKRLGGVE